MSSPFALFVSRRLQAAACALLLLAAAQLAAAAGQASSHAPVAVVVRGTLRR